MVAVVALMVLSKRPRHETAGAITPAKPYDCPNCIWLLRG